MADTASTDRTSTTSASADEWVYLEHDDAGTARVPNDPAVLEHYTARDWRAVDAPDADAPFVPTSSEDEARAAEQARQVAADARAAAAAAGPVGYGHEDGWVELVHPLDGHEGGEARARVPADEAVVQSYLQKGWVLPNKDGSVPARAVKAAAKATQKESTSAPAGSTAADTKEQ